MGNMGYCRFTNTLIDLRDCYEHMDEELSEKEEKAKQQLIEICKDIASDYVEDDDY